MHIDNDTEQMFNIRTFRDFLKEKASEKLVYFENLCNED